MSWNSNSFYEVSIRIQQNPEKGYNKKGNYRVNSFMNINAKISQILAN
jgi:PKD repeat protein